MADKLLWMKFYSRDWLSDPQLSQCKPATRGVWIDLISSMDVDGRTGKIEGTPEALARMCRCDPRVFTIACHDLKETGTADVTECNGKVTITNRRMEREAIKKEATRKRVVAHRKRTALNESNADLTPSRALPEIESETETEAEEDKGEEGNPPPAQESSQITSQDHHITRLLCAWIQAVDGREIRDGSPGFKFRLEKIIAPLRREYKDDARIKAIFKHYDTKEKLGPISIAGDWDFKNNISRLEARIRNSPEGRNQADCDRVRARTKAKQKRSKG